VSERLENRVRVAVQLVDATEDKHLWAQSYDRELEDIFEVQTDVARRVADALKVQLLARETSQIERKATQNIEAYLLYLKGRQFWNRRFKDSVGRAIECFNLAIEKDSNFALAYVGLADCYNILADYGVLQPSEAYPKAKQTAMKALELDDTLAEAHASYAVILSAHEWKWGAAESEFRRAIELNPNYASAHQWYSIHLRCTGRPEEALAEARKALELDPLSPIMNTNVGDRLFALKQYDLAIEYFRKSLAIEPDFVPAHASLFFT